MTVKEFNTIKAAAFNACTNIPEIQEILSTGYAAHVWEVWEGQKHEYIVTSGLSQMNDNLLRKHGFTPEKAKVQRLFWAIPSCKTIYC